VGESEEEKSGEFEKGLVGSRLTVVNKISIFGIEE
jgi:hypothetical protein